MGDRNSNESEHEKEMNTFSANMLRMRSADVSRLRFHVLVRLIVLILKKRKAKKEEKRSHLFKYVVCATNSLSVTDEFEFECCFDLNVFLINPRMSCCRCSSNPLGISFFNRRKEERAFFFRRGDRVRCH